MRIRIASMVTIVLLTAMVYLVAVPLETLCVASSSIDKRAVSTLGPLLTSYLDLHTKQQAEMIQVRLWMHHGDPKMNGCGLCFKVSGYSGRNVSDCFPDLYDHMCGNKIYEMRMTSQSVMYDKSVRLGNEQVNEIEVYSDGWQDTLIHGLCIILNARTIINGPSSFCISNGFLKTCKARTGKWSDIDLRYLVDPQEDNILLTRTTRGIHKIVFRDLENMVKAFLNYDRDPDALGVLSTICSRIELVKGTDSESDRNCPAKRANVVGHRTGMSSTLGTIYIPENKNPYGCDRFTNEDI